MSGATFLTRNLLESSKLLPELVVQMDFVWAHRLLHLFNRNDQLKVACRLVLLTRDRKGSLILGRQMGAVAAGEFQAISTDRATFFHNPESFEELWREVGRLTGTCWKCRPWFDGQDITTRGNAGENWMSKDSHRLNFVVERDALQDDQ